METLHRLSVWIFSHWACILGGLVVVASVLNAASRHWTRLEGLAKVGGFLLEVASILRSKDAPSGILGPVKLPGQSVAPTKGDSVGSGTKTVLLLVGVGLAAGSVSGCASWQSVAVGSLQVAHQIATGASSVAEPAYRDKCGAVAAGCAARSDKTCSALVACQEERHKVNKAIVATHLGEISAYGLILVGQESGAKAAVASVVKLGAELAALAAKAGGIP